MPRSSLNNLQLHLSLGLPGFVAPEFLVEEVGGDVLYCMWGRLGRGGGAYREGMGQAAEVQL